jgi:fumarate reductase iron-sulfur subunit
MLTGVGLIIFVWSHMVLVASVYLGIEAMNRIARFMTDPRDERTTDDFFDVIGNDEGIFGRMGLLACRDVCPKNIPLQDQLGILRLKMGWTAVKGLFRFDSS